MPLAARKRDAAHPIPPCRVCAHERYNLTCRRYDELRSHADDRCQVCGVSQRRLIRPLCVDHDHYGYTWHVRGLLCKPCNVALTCTTEIFAEAEAAYLQKPWWRTAYPAPHPAVEPEIGSVAVDWAGYGWRRGQKGWESSSKFHRYTCRTWGRMLSVAAPLVVVEM